MLVSWLSWATSPSPSVRFHLERVSRKKKKKQENPSTHKDDTEQALTDLYSSTSGLSWNNSLNWNTGDPCTNAWHGIICDASNTSVLQMWVNEPISTSLSCTQLILSTVILAVIISREQFRPLSGISRVSLLCTLLCFYLFFFLLFSLWKLSQLSLFLANSSG